MQVQGETWSEAARPAGTTAPRPLAPDVTAPGTLARGRESLSPSGAMSCGCGSLRASGVSLAAGLSPRGSPLRRSRQHGSLCGTQRPRLESHPSAWIRFTPEQRKCGWPAGEGPLPVPVAPWTALWPDWPRGHARLAPSAPTRGPPRPRPAQGASRTIMPVPTEAWATALSPSDRFSVTERPSSTVSADRRLTSSPVLVLSKKATSCLSTAVNSEMRSRFTMRWPAEHEVGGQPAGPMRLAPPPVHGPLCPAGQA